ncbi:50S ribosomal protein L9 [Sulfurihydrogenibium azorense]|jgi:large subunit ribosomal protein L9|uniref:Large ribosomal subunit protein bL9 n=1 Tax=Sulfurihydrogenibium azorense (strain DSM 15241 / OCM 825 / Az-Fu1) TaxID=204536 RepID=C1DTN1_SULAA|nr:50S ribosomal protein L9 [Sulfurihydrogenibium azorense]ACN98705.1 ribosomal protein L9 [Sulfurihydrogenibium azorense Az-Fu1]MDM7273637.1 50S ribosomal protein L9 [Sulfurihydrogenibium azorense]
MKVILTKDVEGWGTLGDIIEVKDGFARNYLIPRGLAYPANDQYVKYVQEILNHKARKLQREKEKALELAKKLDGVEIEIKRPIGVTGKMYGSVGTNDIAEKLAEKGIEIDRKKIMLRSPIRNLGSYNVQIKLHPEVSATIRVHVQPE